MEQHQMQLIPVTDLYGYDKLPVDVFILLDERFILVVKTGSQSVHIGKFAAKGVTNFFIRRQDIAFLTQIAISEANTESGNTASRLQGLHTAMSGVSREIEMLGFTDETFEHARQVNQVTLNVLAQNPRLIDMVAKIHSMVDGDSAKHSMLVSMLSAMLGIGHGWSKPGTIEKLALSGLLHDVGRTKIPLDLRDKPISSMSNDERLIYESHGEIGALLLKQVKSVPDDVLLAVHEHHELADGSGYPRKIKDLHTSPLARVVSLADFIAEELDLLQNADGGADAKLKMSMVVDKVLSRSRMFNKEAIGALQKIAPRGLLKTG